MGGVIVAEQWWAMVLASLLIVLMSRLAFVLWYTGKRLSTSCRRDPVRTLIVLGSGGHTAEMLNLVAILNKERFYPRWYIAAATDNMSLERAQTAEESGMDQVGCKAFQGVKYMQIYRSREVGQSYVTSIGTTLKAMVHAASLIFKIRPDVILCNGPGTCIPLCVAGFGLKVLASYRKSSASTKSCALLFRKLYYHILLLKVLIVPSCFLLTVFGKWFLQRRNIGSHGEGFSLMAVARVEEEIS